jgi:hypothetical protein
MLMTLPVFSKLSSEKGVGYRSAIFSQNFFCFSALVMRSSYRVEWIVDKQLNSVARAGCLPLRQEGGL